MEIFRKKFVQEDLKKLKLPTGSKLDKHERAGAEFKVRDDKDNDRTWKCYWSRSSGNQSHLNVEGWPGFVNSKRIEANHSWIALHKEDDPFSSGATPYKFEVGKN